MQTQRRREMSLASTRPSQCCQRTFHLVGSCACSGSPKVGSDALENNPELELQQIPCLESWDSYALASPSFPHVLSPITSSPLSPSQGSHSSHGGHWTFPSQRSLTWLPSHLWGWGPRYQAQAVPRPFPRPLVQGKVSCTKQTREVPSDCSISAFPGLLQVSYSVVSQASEVWSFSF